MTTRIGYLRFLALAIALALLPCSRSEAQYFGQNRVQYRSFDMRVLKTAQFDIYYYPEEEQAARLAARMAERWNARLSRLLDARLPTRQPLILYASQPDFQQTNTLGGQEPGEGTGGVTEPFKRRVILPFAGSLGETDHVLGHELVHAFQYSMASRATTGLEASPMEHMPLWFIEGMAEYLSIGPVDANTAMWMRDAVARKKVPKIKQLDNAKYFPYRWGQALWAYIGGRWGDPVVGKILHAAARNGDSRGAIEHTLGMKIDVLSKEWHEALEKAYRPAIERTRTAELKPLLGDVGRGRMNLGPAVSPDGQRVMFLSEKSLFAVELYMADTKSGQVEKRVSNSVLNTRVDSLNFISSAGAWDPSGRRFVHAVVERGRPTLIVRDVPRDHVDKEIALPQLGEVYNPSWSPDGQRIVFSALVGGVTDLFVYDLQSDKLARLTQDEYADLQPAWSPDGKKIVFSTDRFSSDLSDLHFGNYRLALIDPETKAIEPLPTFTYAKSINPQWSSDGASIYFVADRDGVSNIFRLERATGQLFQVTDLLTGVSGLTPMSPAISSAFSTSRLTFTAYKADRYVLYSLDDATALAGRPVESDTPGPALAQLPPEDRSYDQVVALKHDPDYGLPPAGDFRITPYHPQLALDYVTQPSIGVGVDRFGTFVGGGTSLGFSDMLGDHNLQLTFQASGGFSDVAAIASHTNLHSRLNWGVSMGQIPYILGSPEAIAVDPASGNYQIIDYVERQIERQVGAMAAYPFSRAQRIEVMGGYRHISYQVETQSTLYDALGGLITYDSQKNSLAPSLNLFEGSTALVYDTSVFGATSPLLGRAYRLEVGNVAGSLHYNTLLGDVRQYVIPVRPFTVAARALFYGRFGSGANDYRLYPIYLGNPGLVRGYDPNSINSNECGTDQSGQSRTGCAFIDRTGGSKVLVANLELRFPLLGLLGGNSYFGPFPVEAALFADSGAAWTGGSWKDVPTLIGSGHQSFSSAGVALRVNVFGLAVVEVDYVLPLDRPQKNHVWQFNLTPGF